MELFSRYRAETIRDAASLRRRPPYYRRYREGIRRPSHVPYSSDSRQRRYTCAVGKGPGRQGGRQAGTQGHNPYTHVSATPPESVTPHDLSAEKICWRRPARAELTRPRLNTVASASPLPQQTQSRQLQLHPAAQLHSPPLQHFSAPADTCSRARPSVAAAISHLPVSMLA